MHIFNYKNLSIIILVGLIAAACSALPTPPGQEDATPIPTVISDIEIVSEGRLVPNESVDLSFFTSGQVEEVLVEEGDLVSKGDIVAHLGNREELEARIANAETELLAANQTLDRLHEDVDILRAEAIKSIADANKSVRDAQYQLDNYTIPVRQAELETMEAINLMKERLDAARAAFEPYKYKSSSNPVREDRKDDLEDAQSDFDSAVKRMQYETELEQAQARQTRALEDFQKLQEGPDEDEIAAAESQIAAAEANLKSAKVALDHLELESTIDGSVVEQDLIVGQQVTAGQQVMKIVDFSQMYAETDDLTELEVVDISLGQKVTVVPDALPELELTGTVEKIGEIFEEKRGDITYTARIRLDEFDPRLRWGMTVVITFKE